MSGLKTLFHGPRSLLTGLGITLKNFFRRPVTLTYPHEKPELSARFRSAIALVRFDSIGTHDCIACMQCVKTCPSFCITVEGGRPDGLKRKRASRFLVDYALCSVCGLCVDVCPTETLAYSKIYDVVGYTRDGFVYDLLDPFMADESAYLERARAEAKAAEAAKAAKKAEDAERPERAGEENEPEQNGVEAGKATASAGEGGSEPAGEPAAS